MSKIKVEHIPGLIAELPRTLSLEEVSMLAAYGVVPEDFQSLSDLDRQSLRKSLAKHDGFYQDDPNYSVRERILSELCNGRLGSYGYRRVSKNVLTDLSPDWGRQQKPVPVQPWHWGRRGRFCLFAKDYWDVAALFVSRDIAFEKIVFAHGDALVIFTKPIIGKLDLVKKGRKKEIDRAWIQKYLAQDEVSKGGYNRTELRDLVGEAYKESRGPRPCDRILDEELAKGRRANSKLY